MEKNLTSILSYFERLTQAFPEHNYKETPPKKLLRFCLFYMQGFKKPLAFIGVISFFRAVMSVSLFGFMGKIVDWLAKSNPATFLSDEKYSLALMAVVLLIFLPLTTVLSFLFRHQSLMGNFPMSIRWRMHNYLLGQSMSFYQDEFAGRIAAKVMQSALAIRQLVIKSVDLFIYILVYFASMFVLVFSLHKLLLVPVLIWFFTYAFIQYYFVPKLKKVSQEQAHARSTMTGRITDAYSNIATVKLFSHTQKESEYAKDSMDGFMDTVYRQFRLVTNLDICLNVLNYLLLFAVSATGIYLWIKGECGAGAVAVATALAMRLDGISQWLMWEVSSVFEELGTITDGMNTVALPKAVEDCDNCTELQVAGGDIRFENVSFSYHQPTPKIHNEDDEFGEKETKPLAVIKNLSLHIKAGEKIGLVGRSGAGKSTLVNVLLRFYDIESGKIFIDGQDIATVSQESLRKHIAMVTQDTSLLHRSVRENILYGKPEATEAELAEAIIKSKADGFIPSLSDPQGNVGLDAQVGERGVKLSGGQRQRIAIARVLLKDAPILILDEATSALDSEVEAAIQESLNKLMAGKTVIAIAHRLSTIAAMDRLIILDEGEIVEQGSHAELLAKGGIYKKLWDRQTGGYLGE